MLFHFFVSSLLLLRSFNGGDCVVLPPRLPATTSAPSALMVVFAHHAQSEKETQIKTQTERTKGQNRGKIPSFNSDLRREREYGRNQILSHGIKCSFLSENGSNFSSPL